MIEQNTRESALRREEFHVVLQHWLDESFDNIAGEKDSHAGPAWLWVRHAGDHYYLTAGSTRAGVREYLRLVKDAGGDPEWTLESSVSGTPDRVAVGADHRIVEGFEFYHHAPRR
jgi:hypothetical protein